MGCALGDFVVVLFDSDDAICVVLKGGDGRKRRIHGSLMTILQRVMMLLKHLKRGITSVYDGF